MKQLGWVLAALLAAGCNGQAQQQAASTALAFPGALGFAKSATGGRGGEVVYVTNLNNSGTGSLRDALMVGRTDKPRNVLFAVCGRIQLTASLDIRNNPKLGNVTVAGQTAPCPVVVTGQDTFPGSPNMVMRYLTFLSDGSKTQDGVVMAGFDPNSRDAIFDNLSTGWHSDEVFDIVGGDNGLGGKVRCANMYGSGKNCPRNFTFQDSIAAEGVALGPSQSEDDVGKGFLTYGATNISLVRSLLHSNYRRAPFIYDNTFEAVNNLISNYSGHGEAAMSLSAYWEIGCHSIIGNHFKDGPGTHGTSVMNVVSAEYNSQSKIFLQGNYHHKKRATDTLDEKAIINSTSGFTVATSPACAGQMAKDDPAILNAFDDNAVHDYVLAHAGNQRQGWTTDPVTARWLSEAASGTPAKGTAGKYSCTDDYGDNPNCDGSFDKWSDIPGGFPAFETKTTDPDDTDPDGDGIPSDCEEANGLDPDAASDGAVITASGYSNLDNFLNATAGDPVSGWQACDGSGGTTPAQAPDRSQSRTMRRASARWRAKWKP